MLSYHICFITFHLKSQENLHFKMSNTSHQDWDPVILRRKKTDAERIKSGEYETVARKESPNKNSTQLKRDTLHNFDPESITAPVTSNRDLGLAIQKARCAKIKADGKCMNQTDLDHACGFAKNTVRDYENGTAVVKPDDINKMNRALGVVLPRPGK
ncbi:Multiprotein bridging factor 1 [Yasminevirus sp. GU-2018]|uniref:Multiprotein bridging factor 1 n=1 Tax=Yasminevirus sp. GU-2018 TaxID=2420051 RepID=A0A5K0U8Q8_9VIRU|nr:Multiprotein bridging factor 1 [Yasminevirus sp. GU-2018]